MAGHEPIKAPWVMKRMEVHGGKIVVTDETPTVDLLPDPPVPEQAPLVEECVITERFCDGGPGHPFSLFVNYQCGVCDQSYRVALDGVFGPGNKIIKCECGEKILLPLAFDVSEAPAQPEPPVQVAGWLKFWNPKSS
jgi:hypothetical protein